MAKMPHSCEDHRQPSLIRGCDHLIVADGTAGLDHGCRACLYSCQQPIGEWEEGVGSDRCTNRPRFVPTCLIGGVLGFRSDERRVGRECVSTCSSRGSPSHSNKTKNKRKTCTQK